MKRNCKSLCLVIFRQSESVTMVVSAVDLLCRLAKDVNVNNSNKSNKSEESKWNRRSKSVSFADTKGLALTNTRFYIREDLSPVTKRKSSVCHAKKTKQLTSRPAQLLNFTTIIPYKKIVERVNTWNVCLECMVCYSFGMYGRIRVRNLTFEKCIIVRYTFDGWRSIEDIIATFIPGASNTTTDTFFFHILPPKRDVERKMEFAICYRVCGCEYWDNNFGDNYRLIYHKVGTT